MPGQMALMSRAVLLSNESQEAGVLAETLIAVIDDDAAVREAVAGLIESLGFTVQAFASALDFLAWPNVRDTSCLIVDVQMPRMTGIELHRRLVESGHAIPTILITAFPDESVRARALADGVICYLTKPCNDDELLGCVSSALQRTTPSGHHS